MSNTLLPIEIIENKIFVIRGQRVMLDSDLAQLYDVETKVLNQAVKRNIERFPSEFMFQLNDGEWSKLRSQIVTYDKVIRKYKPYVFTEHGVAMLSSVLKSKLAIAINIQIIKAFVKIREMALVHKELADQLNELEQRFVTYTKENSIEQQEQNKKIGEILQCLQYLIEIHKPSKIGYKREE